MNENTLEDSFLSCFDVFWLQDALQVFFPTGTLLIKENLKSAF